MDRRKKPTISAIIPTFRRWPYLVDTVRYLSVQTVPPDEIVIVDQTPRDEMPDGQPEKLIAESGVRIVYDYQEEPSVYRARNRAAHLASCGLLLYLDDDIIPEPDLVQEYVRVMDDLTVDAATGSNPTPWLEGNLIPPPDGVSIEILAFTWPYARINQRMERTPFSAAGHFCIRKTVLAEIGGWDEHVLTYGDKDMGLRLYKAGKNIVYDPGPKLHHIAAKAGGTRLSDPNSPWSSWERCASHFYLGFRHLRGRYFWKYAVWRAARASVLLRRNALDPLSWPREIWGFIKAFWIARKWAKLGVKSSFPTGGANLAL